MKLAKMVAWLILAVGIALVLLAGLFNNDPKPGFVDVSPAEVRSFCFSLGASVLAAAIVTLINLKSLEPSDKSTRLWTHWGLSEVYGKRSEMSDLCTRYLAQAERVDIAGLRLATFMELHSARLEQRARTGRVDLRILMPNPWKAHPSMIENLLGIRKDSITDAVLSVRNWVLRLRSDFPRSSFQLRFSSDCLLHMYQRIDNTVFFGPYLPRMDSQNCLTFECLHSSTLGQKLGQLFETAIGNSDDGLATTVVIEFFGLPAAGKSTCAAELCSRFSKYGVRHTSNEDVEQDDVETPLSFNGKLIKHLVRQLSALGPRSVLILDRGILDCEAWLNVHEKRFRAGTKQGLDTQAHQKLKAALPDIPKGTTHYVPIYFDQPLEVTLGRQRAFRSAADRWALRQDTLRLLELEYKALCDLNRGSVEVVSSSCELSVLKEAVCKIVQRHLEKWIAPAKDA